jgi:8-oxo-dGTP pyrophosphatase MutT (NUDIX family)
MSDSQVRLERALLDTGMMNKRFVDMIRDGEVDEEYVKAALRNFVQAMHPHPIPVKHRYVVGFLFSQDESKVLLVWKNRPAWQNGKLNGIGGKIEAGETPLQAMEREFKEETYFGALFEHGSNEPTPLHWQYVGRRHRKALFEGQDESYEMFMYAAYIKDVRYAVFDGTFEYPDPSDEVAFVVPNDPDPRREEVIALPLNREILNTKGVPGLAWTVDIALRALHENYHIDVEDPPAHPQETE